MRKSALVILLFVVSVILPAFPKQKSDEEVVKQAAEKCTLNQKGTKPFHLFAKLSPSGPVPDSARTGTVEIWWRSPSQWRREIRSPEFRQIAIVNNGREWQKNDGDYFPQWLEETAVELIEPLPYFDRVLQGVREAEVKSIAGMIHFSWGTGVVSVSEKTGLLLYGGIDGAGGEFLNMQRFHDLMIARKVNVGDPQVTATVELLEDLPTVPTDFFNANAPGADLQQLHTELVDGETLKRNLLNVEPFMWPTVKDGPFEGNAAATFVLDRQGRVRDLSTIVVNNPALRDAAKAAFSAMRFRPYVQNGVPVQVHARMKIPFRTARAASEENFASAKSYFEQGQRASFPSFGAGKPYMLQAEFLLRPRTSGKLETGYYTDTFIAPDKWRREINVVGSSSMRMRNGAKYYRTSKGKDSGLLNAMLKLLEPIPAIDTFTESDWRVRREVLDGNSMIRVFRGEEDLAHAPKDSVSYWFDEKGILLRSYLRGFETRWVAHQDFEGVQVAREAQIYRDGGLVAIMRVIQLSPSAGDTDLTFSIKKHQWHRAFTDEVR